MNKFTKAIAAIMLIVAVTFVAGCNKPDEPNNGNSDSDVRVTTYMPQDITATTAKCGGDVIVTQGLSLNELGVCWGTEHNPTVENFHLSTTNWSNPYVHTITNLEPSTNYYIRAFALRGLEYYYGEEKRFTTLGGELPTLTTSEVTNIMKYTATGGGNITSDGGVPIFERGICWSINSNPTIDDDYANYFDYNGGNMGLGSYNVEMTGLEQNTKYYVRAYAKNYYGISYGSQVSFTTLNPPPIGTYNGHDYIDLGLPSGTLWATCNVGSTIPEDYGDYFAWGETEPKNKFSYNWENYKYCVIVDGLVYLTKYCNNHGYNGFVDNIFVLLPEDDAATANWGDGWCMPSPDQWRELKENTTKIWTVKNGVYGELFISCNGNDLFLPAAGANYGNGVGESCRYWSNSCSNYEAWDNYVDDFSRVLGFSVRPVRCTE